MADAPTFLGEPPATESSRRIYDGDRADGGYVWNFTRLWCWRPDVFESFAALRKELTDGSTLTERDLAVIVTAMASTLGDSYCALAWGRKLAKLSDAETAAQILAGTDQPAGLSAREAALAAWTRAVVRDPNATTPADVDQLRAAGLDEREIFEATAWIAFRVALATVNDALGAGPDRQLAEAAPAPVREAVGYGRPPGAEPSPR